MACPRGDVDSCGVASPSDRPARRPDFALRALASSPSWNESRTMAAPVRPAAPIRLALVNDYAVVVAGLLGLLAPYVHRVEVVELDSQVPVISDVDVLLVDTFGRARFDVVVEKLVAETAAKVAVYTWNLQAEMITRGTDLGVRGFLSKALDASRLVEAIEMVHGGEIVVEPQPFPETPLTQGAWPGKDHALSVRESEVLALIAQGLSNQEVADRAFLSVNSVKTYIRLAYRKVGVTSRTQAVLWALDNGFGPDTTRTLIEPRR